MIEYDVQIEGEHVWRRFEALIPPDAAEAAVRSLDIRDFEVLRADCVRHVRVRVVGGGRDDWTAYCVKASLQFSAEELP